MAKIGEHGEVIWEDSGERYSLSGATLQARVLWMMAPGRRQITEESSEDETACALARTCATTQQQHRWSPITIWRWTAEAHRRSPPPKALQDRFAGLKGRGHFWEGGPPGAQEKEERENFEIIKATKEKCYCFCFCSCGKFQPRRRRVQALRDTSSSSLASSKH